MKVPACVASVLLFATACQKQETLAPAAQATAENQQVTEVKLKGPYKYAEGELLLKFKGGLGDADKSAIFAAVQGKISKRMLTRAMENAGDREGIYLLKVPGDVMAAVEKLKGFDKIIFAEPNYFYAHDAVSNDPYFTSNQLWGMYGKGTSPSNQYGSQAAVAWGAGYTGSSNVVVGVIDEGARYTHEDLAANMWTNPYDPVDGIDNDGNGFIDDVHGWDFFYNDNTTYDGTADDHGTHVSGTIGAKGGNGIGVAGVNWNVTMITVKFLGPTGGYTDDAIESVDYLTDLKTRHGLKIVASNNSWGGGGFSQGLKDAIDRAGAANILFIAAAGNNYGQNLDVSPYYPASYTSSNLIAVASITKTGGLSSFSNIGATTVDLGAPGSGIYSTLPSGANGTYGSYDGTSMATPHVTGAAALYASAKPAATAAKIKSAILAATTATPSLTGKCVTGGRLNISKLK